MAVFCPPEAVVIFHIDHDHPLIVRGSADDFTNISHLLSLLYCAQISYTYPLLTKQSILTPISGLLLLGRTQTPVVAPSRLPLSKPWLLSYQMPCTTRNNPRALPRSCRNIQLSYMTSLLGLVQHTTQSLHHPIMHNNPHPQHTPFSRTQTVQ